MELTTFITDISQKSEDGKDDWRYELIGRINVLDQDDDTVEDYLATYVPSNVSCPEPRTKRNAKTNPFAKWSPKEGEEQQSYPTLVSWWFFLITSTDLGFESASLLGRGAVAIG